MSKHTVEAFGSGARWFEDAGSLIRALHSELSLGVTLLVKGSRSMHMERVVEALSARPAGKAANGDH